MNGRVLLPIALALVVACAPVAQAPVVRATGQATLPAPTVVNGMTVGPLTMHPAMNVYPVAYRTMNAQIRGAYDYAVAHRDILKWMPCYCGCAMPGHGTNGHKNNYDCYVMATNSDGSVTVDLHATSCVTCAGITGDVVSMLQSGTTDLLTIRRAIDQKWSKYGPSTPTPYPPAS